MIFTLKFDILPLVFCFYIFSQLKISICINWPYWKFSISFCFTEFQFFHQMTRFLISKQKIYRTNWLQLAKVRLPWQKWGFGECSLWYFKQFNFLIFISKKWTFKIWLTISPSNSLKVKPTVLRVSVKVTCTIHAVLYLKNTRKYN